VVGSYWTDADAEYCLLAGILPKDIAVSPGAQTSSSFEQMEAALAKVGMDFSHVVRTWFFLDDLLDWYDEFNVARTRFFESRGVFDRLIPASTGIGASNPFGAALSSGTLAIRPRHERVVIQEVASPLQCAATAYRSSFARAVEVGFPDRRYLTISGTASIASGGESMYADDVVKQIHLTLDVVEAILHSRGLSWSDTVRTVGYFREIADLPLFEVCCKERGIAPLPMTPAHATVCRADLLFEMELDAVAAGSGNAK
jgi:enamine deaminase RidA (YjgF/YER057c/UK114 family)